MKIATFFDQLSQEELKDIHKLDNILSEILPYKITLKKKIELWLSTVTEIKNGYDLPDYEYLNDIDGRKTIQKVIDQAPSPLKEKLEELLDKIDQIFLDNSHQVKKIITTDKLAEKNPEKYFWYYRIPNDLSKGLGDDFDENGPKHS